jgi:hypothetical protein
MNAPHATIRPRSLDNVLADVKEARRDYDDALADKHEDRATEAETRLDDLREEFETRLLDATGLTFETLIKAREECLL